MNLALSVGQSSHSVGSDNKQIARNKGERLSCPGINYDGLLNSQWANWLLLTPVDV